MLVLTRLLGQVVEIEHAGETIRVMVTSIVDGRVRLGFDGSQSFRVLRQEISDNHTNKKDVLKHEGTV